MTDPLPAWDVQVGVFGQNEASRIEACLASIAEAAGPRRVLVTVVLNGSTDGSAARAAAIAPQLPVEIRVVTIARPDKANAINRFFYELREDAALYVCVDAYVAIDPGAIAAIEARFAECPEARVVTGVAANGRTEMRAVQQTIEQGGIIHGQLYALCPAFLDRLTGAGIRLPVGLYRGDGLIGSFACHDLDAAHEPWVNQRLAGVAGARYQIDTLSMFRLRDLRRQFRRMVRQMRGVLENAAIKSVIYGGGYTALPDNADDMIRTFLDHHPVPKVALQDRPFMALALRQHRRASPPDPDSLRPVPFPDPVRQP